MSALPSPQEVSGASRSLVQLLGFGELKIGDSFVLVLGHLVAVIVLQGNVLHRDGRGRGHAPPGAMMAPLVILN